MNLTPSEKALLQEILAHTYQHKTFPKKARFRVQHTDQRDTLNRLSDQKFLNDATHDYIITIKGLRACENVQSAEVLRSCDNLLEELQKLYRKDALGEDPHRERNVTELKDALEFSFSPEGLKIFLTILSLEWSSLSAIASFAYENTTHGFVSSIRLFEGILDVQPVIVASRVTPISSALDAATNKSLSIRVENFRALRRFYWQPEGVCVLVGPNGGGKTTALQILECLRRGLSDGFVAGLELFGQGPVRHLSTNKEDLCAIKLELGELSWTIQPSRSDRVHERVRAGSTDLVTRVVGDSDLVTVGGVRLSVNNEMALERAFNGVPALTRQLEPLVRVIKSSRYYARYKLDLLRESGSPQSRDVRLDSDGRNLFAVLRNWRDAGEHQHRWSFVNEQAAAFFPGWYRSLNFDTLAQRVSGFVVHHSWSEKLAPTDWSDGFFTALLHLAALASADPGGVIAIDEPEISLHPALIKSVLLAMRDWSAAHNVAVLLSSHSPVVLDQFREEPDQVFVMEPEQQDLPIALDKLKKAEWLARYSLGELYSHLAFGAPAGQTK